MLSLLTQEICVCACVLPDSESNEVLVTDIVYCVFNWAADVAVNRCLLPFPGFVKQIVILWSQTPNRLAQATRHPVSRSLFT